MKVLSLSLLLLLACGDAGETETTPHTNAPNTTNRQSETNRQPEDTLSNVDENAENLDVNRITSTADGVNVDDSPSDVDPLGDLNLEEVLNGPGQVQALHPIALTAAERAGRAAPGTCTSLIGSAARLSTDRGPALVRAGGGAFVLAGYAMGTQGPKVYAVRFSPDGHTRPLFSEALTRASARRLSRVPPGLDVQGDRALLTWVDGDHVRAAVLSVSARGGARVLDLAEGADARFSPAVAVRPRGSLVAYTESATPMHVRLVTLSLGGEVVTHADLTPPQLGAAAPNFAAVRGGVPRLYFLEPRSGVSALYRVDFDSELVPGSAILVRPIRNVYEPPRIAVVNASGGLVGYSALGNAATTAIGLLPLGDASAAPVALLRGTGFGLFGLDAAALPRAALFVFGAPAAAEGAAPNHAPHDVEVRLADPSPRTPLVFSRPGGAESPSVAVDSDGMIALTYAAQGGVYLRWLSCTPG
jgi:hypothetical protein